MRSKNYKAIEVKFGRKTKYILFNLNSDPFERDNIYDKELKIGTKLFKEMHLLFKETEKRSFKPKSIVLDEKLNEHLRSLGYIK